MSNGWTVFDYEKWMFSDLPGLDSLAYPQAVRNAITESQLLHTRMLCDMLLSLDTFPDAVDLKTLLPGFDPPSVANLKTIYGHASDPNSPRVILNKRFAHASNMRGNQFDYTPTLNVLRPAIVACLGEAETERKQRGL